MDKTIYSILDDPSILDDMTEEQLLDIQKKINPVGTISVGHESYAVLSLINMRENYIRKFTATAMVSYLFSVLKTYDGPGIQDIETFIKSIFIFNPDKHVSMFRTYSHNSDSMIKRPEAFSESKTLIKSVDEDIKDIKPDEIIFTAAKIDTIKEQLSRLIRGQVIPMIKNLGRSDLLSTANSITQKLSEIKPILQDEFQDNLVIPDDLFFNFNRYIDVHYESLKMTVNRIYSDIADVTDNIAVYYDSFKTKDEAIQFMEANGPNFKVSPIVISNAGPVLYGPFHENKEKVDLVTKDSSVLKEIMETAEKDQKIGKEILNRRLHNFSASKFIKDGGTSEKGLQQYMAARDIVKKIGKEKHELSPEEKEKLIKGKQDIIENTVPAGTVAVQTWEPVLKDGKVIDLEDKYYIADVQNEKLTK